MIHVVTDASHLRAAARGVGFRMTWHQITGLAGANASLVWGELYYRSQGHQGGLQLQVSYPELAAVVQLTKHQVRRAIGALAGEGLLVAERTRDGVRITLNPSRFRQVLDPAVGLVALDGGQSGTGATQSGTGATQSGTGANLEPGTDGDRMGFDPPQNGRKVETPQPPKGGEALRALMEDWLAEHDRRTNASPRRGPGSGRGFFGADGALEVRHELELLASEHPGPLAEVLPRFWESWDQARKGHHRGVQRMLQHLHQLLTEAGKPAPVDQLLGEFSAKRL